MDKKLYDLIDSYADAFAAHLTRWIQVPSVKDETGATVAPGAPFGAEVRKMYDMALADCEAEGFVTRMSRVLSALENNWTCYMLDCDKAGARVI